MPTSNSRRDRLFARNSDKLHVAFSKGITKIATTPEEQMAYDRLEKKDRELIEKS